MAQRQNVYEQFVKILQENELPVDYNFIASAFILDDTPEGFDFWRKIDNEYSNWYRKEFADEFIPFKEGLTIEDALKNLYRTLKVLKNIKSYVLGTYKSRLSKILDNASIFKAHHQGYGIIS